MPTLTINGQEITVEPDTTIIEAAEKLGIAIPHFCYHPALSAPANCRMCLVEVEGRPKLEVSCRSTVQDGMVVHTESPRVLEARRYVMEFLLVNHPLDCPECDQAGECTLQDYSFEHGPAHSRYKEKKRTFPYKDLGPHVVHHTTRCIMCTRCIRFCEEIAGVPELRAFEHGNMSQIDIFPGKPLANPLSGNVVDMCPVGALIDKDFLHKARVWNLERTNSVCHLCASGCSIYIDQKDNEIQRLKPRLNGNVNSYWICDEGRYGYHEWENVKRAVHPLKNKGRDTVSWDEASGAVVDGFNEVIKKHGRSAVAGIGSASAANEENFLISVLIKEVIGGEQTALYRFDSGKEDRVFKNGFTISGDKNPNTAGARLILGEKSDTNGMKELLENIHSGSVKAVYFLAQDWWDGISQEMFDAFGKLEFFVVQNSAITSLTEMADIVLPSANSYENTGTYVNRNGCLQKIQPGILPPGEARPGWKILANLISAFGASRFATIDAVFGKLAETISGLNGMQFQQLEPSGLMLPDFDKEYIKAGLNRLKLNLTEKNSPPNPLS